MNSTPGTFAVLHATTVCRPRGKSPRQAAFFTRSPKLTEESSLLASLCSLLGVLPRAGTPINQQALARLSRGELLYQAFAVYRELVAQPRMASEFAAPMFCAGITVFGPLLRHGIAGPCRLGIIGIGGLGHVALQFGRALGCHVIAFSTSAAKAAEAELFGANEFVDTSRPGALSAYAGSCDFLMSTVTADIAWGEYVQVLRPGGKLCVVGVPEHEVRIPALPFIIGQKSLVSGCVGSRSEIRTMLEFAARHQIRPQIELFPMQDANRALDRLRRNELRYRAVLVN